MQIVQAVGPFKAGERIEFDYPDPKYTFRYIKVGVQAPQVPPITEVDNISQMIRFSIGTSSVNTRNNLFYINANDILEFEDFYSVREFNIRPLQDMDAYTIVEVAFSDEQEVA